MRKMQAVLLASAIAILSGCTGPAARTPSNPDVLAVLARGGGFVNVGPNSSGAFEILPGALPSGGYHVYFDAPYPTSLRITIDGDNLPRFQDIPSGADPAVTGWFKVADTNIRLTPPKWKVAIRPPQAKLAAASHQLRIFDVSNNSAYRVGTPAHESSPLLLQMVAAPVYRLTVVHAGSGNGGIRSDIAGIDCGVDCQEDYPQSRTTVLTPHPDSASRWVGWAVNCPAPSICHCTGGGSTCTVTLNGAPVMVTATFGKRSLAADPIQSCPPPRLDPSLTYVGQPDCATGVRDQHPTASLACDAQGFFCCESVTGANEPRCGGGGKRQFLADCMAFSPTGGPPPTGILDGCYRRN
jgi:hypothetical protein